MANVTWPHDLPESDQRDQLKLIYDYIKLHIGLYLSTPPALALVADGFGVKTERIFVWCLVGAVGLFLVCGVHAGVFLSRWVNYPWDTSYLDRFGREAFGARRRFFHHYLYWVGLAVGLVGLIASVATKSPPSTP